MQLESVITMQEEELEEAILEYVNKHKGTTFDTMTSVLLTNGLESGAEESPVLITGIKFNAS